MLDWTTFDGLPGSAEWNFECVCRRAVRSNFGHLGEVKGTAQQPGVEFHLQLNTDHSQLGKAGRWWGWQCRLWKNPVGRSMSDRQKEKVVEAIAKSEKYLPGLTDWVLWTRRSLTPTDETWFFGLATSLTLHSWTAEDDLDTLLVGDALLTREAFFGDLALLPQDLDEIHKQALAPIRDRWNPAVHQRSSTETSVRDTLLDTQVGSRVEEAAKAIDRDLKALLLSTAKRAAPEPVDAMITAAEQERDVLSGLLEKIRLADFEATRELTQAGIARGLLTKAVHELRRSRDGSSVEATNLASSIQRSLAVRLAISERTASGLVAVVGRAGYGKTELAAAITEPQTGRPAGVLLEGRHLPQDGSLDDLANRVEVHGKRLTMSGLVAALDAAAKRARTRLPIVIDGLNEAEDPRQFRSLLSALEQQLNSHRNVVVVVTVRDEFAETAVPQDVPWLSLDGFGRDIGSAFRRYADHYKVRVSAAAVPQIMDHPLSMRLAFETANPERKAWVDHRALPATHQDLMALYVKTCLARIEDLTPARRRLYRQESEQYLDVFGRLLWKRNARYVSEEKARKKTGDTGPWMESRTFALLQEGVLIDDVSPKDHTRDLAALFDRLGGYFAGRSITQRHTARELEVWLRRKKQVRKLARGPGRHPLADDILATLAYHLAAHDHRQLWELMREELVDDCLLLAAGLAEGLLDGVTIAEMEKRAESLLSKDRGRFLSLLSSRRASTSDPLNAAFVGRVLSGLTMAQRDLLWSEWLRSRADSVTGDLQALAERWQRQGVLEDERSELLQARWAMLCLSSTVFAIRDLATFALFSFGLRDPRGLFTLALEALAMDDEWVAERALAAAYGAATNLPEDEPTGQAVAFLVDGLHQILVGQSGKPSAPTNNWTVRYVARSLDQLLQVRWQMTPRDWPFLRGPLAVGMPEDQARKRLKGAVRSDFANYTVGGLFDDRRNYDDNHAEWRQSIERVFGTIIEAGWNSDDFERTDSLLDSFGRRERAREVERYAKKYSWIAYKREAGLLVERGLLDSAPAGMHLDPTFPLALPAAPFTTPSWAGGRTKRDLDWLRKDLLPADDLFLRDAAMPGGDWVLSHAFLQTENEDNGREVYGFFDCFLVDASAVPATEAYLREVSHPDRFLLDPATEYQVFAGEFPWHPRLVALVDEDDHYYRRELPAVTRPIPLEVITHEYAYEGKGPFASNATLPTLSIRVVEKLALSRLPRQLCYVDRDGSAGSMAFRAPSGFTGSMHYIRRDLLLEYAGDRVPIIFSWGERRVGRPRLQDPTEAELKVYRSGANRWRKTVVVDR